MATWRRMSCKIAPLWWNLGISVFQYVTNQPTKANSAFHPSGVGKWVTASASGKAKAGMVHSVSGWTRGVQVKLWDPLRTRAISKRGVHDMVLYKSTFTLPYLTTTKFGYTNKIPFHYSACYTHTRVSSYTKTTAFRLLVARLQL